MFFYSFLFQPIGYEDVLRMREREKRNKRNFYQFGKKINKIFDE